jgi:hypothetical protein
MEDRKRLAQFVRDLSEFDATRFLHEAELRAHTVPVIGIPYSKQEGGILVLDRTPFVGFHERIEIPVDGIAAFLKLPEREIGGQVVPMVKAFVRNGVVCSRVQAYTVERREPQRDESIRERLGDLLKPLDDHLRTRIFDEFEAILEKLPSAAPFELGDAEMHVACDAGHTDDDLIM